MSTAPGGVTVTINCMIVAGFPGIGKTNTWKQMKHDFIGAKCVDLDVKDWGTTNGMDVADPGAYVEKIKELSTDNACIFVSCDPAVRERLREAHLFYIVVAPEFPPELGAQMPGYRPDPLAQANYMRRFTETLGYNSKAPQLLDGNGYRQCIADCFNDPMPHIVAPVITKEIINDIWAQLDQMTRQTVSPSALPGLMGGKMDIHDEAKAVQAIMGGNKGMTPLSGISKNVGGGMGMPGMKRQ